MYSKYILNTNWVDLSGIYDHDSNVSLKNQKIHIDGNLSVNFSPFLTLSKDYTYSGYSFLFLTNQNPINNLLDIQEIDNEIKSQTCLIASNYKDNKVVEDTSFFTLSSNYFKLKNISELNEESFLEFFIINESEILLYRIQNNIYYYFSIDPFTESLISLSSLKSPYDFNIYDKDKIKLNFAYYSNNKSIIFYRYFQNNYYSIINEDNLLVVRKSERENITDSKALFTLLNIKDIPNIRPSVNWLSYKRGSNLDNLNIDKSRSLQDIKNNYLFHFEPGYFDNKFTLNLLTLKNQINYNDNLIRNSNNNHTFRNYLSLFCGGNREHGYSNINISYSSDHTIYNFLPDKTTWFRLPGVKDKIIVNINDTNLFENGAIAGASPLYSDKLWKKNAGYTYTSNLGESSFREHTGQWLCAWLSGGDNKGIWVNRFYNPDVFTPFEAISYNANVDYRPQYFKKYKEGIVDIPSDITIETGGWYAYSRIGKKTAKKIIDSYNNKIIFKNLSLFKDYNNNDLYYQIDNNGDASYDFDNKNYGILPINNFKDNYNNFTLSFFASRDNWNISREHQLVGNYLNEGFGFFNCEDINPLIYYLENNSTKIIFNNNEINSVLEIDLTKFLPFEQSQIAGVFYTGLLENFFIVTRVGILLEFTSNGTIVETLSVITSPNVSVNSCANNSNFGVISLDNYTCLKIDLASKNYTVIDRNNVTQFNLTGVGKEVILIDNNDRIYLTTGGSPVIKNNRVYYYDRVGNNISYFNIDDNTITNYLTGLRSAIRDFTFDNGGNTYLLFDNSVDYYNALGSFVENVPINISAASGCNIGVLKVDDKEDCFVMLSDNNNNLYFYNLSNKNKKIINLKTEQDFTQNYDFSFDKFLQTTKRNTIRVPIYRFKLKLKELVNTEKFIILDSIILGENLGTGEHHFAVTLDTIKGVFAVYIDKRLYMKKTFEPGRYSYSSVLKENFIIGTSPFYGNTTYNTFYKTVNKNFYATDFKIKNIRFYNESFNQDQINMLFLEKQGTKTLSTFFKTGDRSFIDTIVRTFKNKMPGKKSNLINLYISNTNISDFNLQQMYNNIIVKKLKNILPGYVKINKIKWLANKRESEKMLEGYFNRKNTLTEN